MLLEFKRDSAKKDYQRILDEISEKQHRLEASGIRDPQEVSTATLGSLQNLKSGSFLVVLFSPISLIGKLRQIKATAKFVFISHMVEQYRKNKAKVNCLRNH